MTDSVSVLHVDDDPDKTATFLEQEDNRLIVGKEMSAKEGLNRLSNETIDCVVSGYDLCGQNGINFLKAVRDKNSSLPFILFPANGCEEIASEAISAGVTDYIQRGAHSDPYEVLANCIFEHVDQTDIKEALSENESHLRQTKTSDGPERSEEELRVFRKAVEAAGHSIYFTNTSGDIKYVNPAFEETTGFPAHEAIGQNPRILQSGEHDAKFYEELWDTILSGDTWQSEVINKTRDGDQYTVNQTIAPVENESGKIEYFVAVNTDITDQKKKEHVLREERDRREALFRNPADSIVEIRFKNETPVIEATNDRFDEVFGFDPETIVGQPVPSILVPDDEGAEKRHARIKQQVLRGEPVDTTVRRQTRDGIRDFLLRVFPIETVEGERRSYAIYTDITERKEREKELKRQNELLDEFVTAVSHDLRNPMQVLRGAIERGKTTGRDEHFERAQRAVDRMETLVDDLLMLAGDDETLSEIESLSVSTKARECWDNVATENGTLVVRSDQTIQADESKLKQLFENLISNAIEYGGEDVTITVGSLDDGFYIADNGPGIPEEKRTEVFRSGYSTSGSGVGFGLAIVERIANGHGWDVSVTDSKEGGARFEITNIE